MAIDNILIDGGGSSTYWGRRQGVAVLSGRNIMVRGGTIRGSLIGIDVEIDANQVANGYDYIEDVRVLGVRIEDCGSEGVAYAL